MLTAMEGAVMLARTYQNIDAYDAGVTQLRDYFDRLLKDGTNWSMPRPQVATPSSSKSQIKRKFKTRSPK